MESSGFPVLRAMKRKAYQEVAAKLAALKYGPQINPHPRSKFDVIIFYRAIDKVTLQSNLGLRSER